MQRILIAIFLLINAEMMFVFIDGLAAVGRYDAGIKWVFLQLPYLSMALSICAIFLLGKRALALGLVALALLLFLPLFVHECLPGMIGIVDPAYRSPDGGGETVPFWRFDPMALAIVGIFLGEIAALSLRRAKPGAAPIAT